MVDVVNVVMGMWCVVGLEKGFVKCCGNFEREVCFPCHCSGIVLAITLWILRLKLWGLVFWKAYDFSYKFDVLSFCI